MLGKNIFKQTDGNKLHQWHQRKLHLCLWNAYFSKSCHTHSAAKCKMMYQLLSEPMNQHCEDTAAWLAETLWPEVEST